MKSNIIFASYDGIAGNIANSQILPYIIFLSKNYNITIYSLEKNYNLKKKNLLEKCFKKLNITWVHETYNYNNLFSLVISLIKFNFNFFFLLSKIEHKLVHIRSFPSFFLVLGSIYLSKIKIIYDIRGFWIDEKIDRFNWKQNSLKVKLLKSINNYFIKKSNIIITLTDDSKRILSQKFINKEIVNIPTCVNIYKFNENSVFKKKVLNFGHLGSIQYAYDFNKILFFFKKYLSIESKAKLFIYSSDSKNLILKYLNNNNIESKNYEIQNINHSKIHLFMKNIDFGIFYLKKNYSIRASFPTKIGEFFSSNIPILCNNFNEDINQIFNNNKIGVFSNFKNDIDIKKLYYNINSIYLENFNNKFARKYSEINLNLETSKIQYLSLYEKLIEYDE